jgi:hypothetical protein
MHALLAWRHSFLENDCAQFGTPPEIQSTEENQAESEPIKSAIFQQAQTVLTHLLRCAKSCADKRIRAIWRSSGVTDYRDFIKQRVEFLSLGAPERVA